MMINNDEMRLDTAAETWHLSADTRPRQFVFKNHQNVRVAELGCQVQRGHTFL